MSSVKKSSHLFIPWCHFLGGRHFLRVLEVSFLNMSNVRYLPGFRKFEFGLSPLQLTTAVLRAFFPNRMKLEERSASTDNTASTAKLVLQQASSV